MTALLLLAALAADCPNPLAPAYNSDCLIGCRVTVTVTRTATPTIVDPDGDAWVLAPPTQPAQPSVTIDGINAPVIGRKPTSAIPMLSGPPPKGGK